MSQEANYINLKEIAEAIQAPANQWGQDRLAIWGGQLSEGSLLSFLNGWSLNQMPYRLWHDVSEISFSREGKQPLPRNINLLEQGHLFGPGGDLTLRRDGPNFHWHFIGRQDQPKPPAQGQPKDFWQHNADIVFYHNQETALLWGEYQAGLNRWHDDRVARASLTYPIPDGETWSRVQLVYWTFSRAGQIEFVWFRDLQAWKGEE